VEVPANHTVVVVTAVVKPLSVEYLILYGIAFNPLISSFALTFTVLELICPLTETTENADAGVVSIFKQ
jgi:hypothetical protein